MNSKAHENLPKFILKVSIQVGQKKRHSEPMYCMMNGFKGTQNVTTVNITQRYITINLQKKKRDLAVTFDDAILPST